MALNLTAAQSTSINAVETDIEEAYRNGVTGSGLSPTIDPVNHYADDVVMGGGDSARANAMRKMMKDTFKGALAALLSALHIYGPLPAVRFSGTVVLAKVSALGANGSLTISDGFVTAYSAPT